MFIFDLLLAAVLFLSVRFCSSSNESYLSKDSTNMIKGIFVFLILLSHLWGYMLENGVSTNMLDAMGLKIQAGFGQLVVAMFLFYSGYGVMSSIINKGDNYVRSFPKRRILITWLNFCVAVLCYIGVNLILGRSLTISAVIGSFFAWTSIGNSCWYIFCILICYLLTYVSFSFNRGILSKEKRYHAGTLILMGGGLLYCYIISLFKDAYWYDTVLCYCLGVLFAQYVDRFEVLLRTRYSIALGVLAITFVSLYYLVPRTGIEFFDNFEALVFCLLIVTLSFKFRLRSNALLWLGKNIFPIYIYQRVPMLLLGGVEDGMLLREYKYMYAILCILGTLLIAYFYQNIRIKENHLFFGKER